MEYTIWKFKLPWSGKVTLTMPMFSETLKVAEQHGDLNLWALVPVSNQTDIKDTVDHTLRCDPEDRTFYILVTGETLEDAHKKNHVGTTVTHNGDYVVHVFEES